jgi:hypothetical protein
MRKNILLLILAGMIFCALVASSLLTGSGDTLYGCTSTLALDRSSYHIGDTVTMTFTLIPKNRRTVRFYSAMQKNIVIEPLEHSGFLPRSGEIHRETFSPESPLIVKITGKVVAGPVKGTAIVDFGEYGREKVLFGKNLDLHAGAFPAIIPVDDSRGWPGSNYATLMILEGAADRVVQPSVTVR